MNDALPGVPRGAALLGTGSEVLGFDTERSTDHGWGPRVIVFLPDDIDLGEAPRHLTSAIDARLPGMFGGFPTRFAATTGGPVKHQVTFAHVGSWFYAVIGFDPRGDVSSIDWLSAPSQALRSVTAGEVFEDAANLLTEAREQLRWYPDDVWLYLLACQWQRISQEEPFIGRTGEVGDDLGSAIVTARLVRDLMRLCFLMEREYAPYSKWLGTAFLRLKCGPILSSPFQRALSATHWRQRESALVPAMEMIARTFNDLHLVAKQDSTVRYFYGRPFLVLDAERFAAVCMGETPLAGRGYTGSIDQFVDSTDVLSHPGTAERLRNFIAGPLLQ